MKQTFAAILHNLALWAVLIYAVLKPAVAPASIIFASDEAASLALGATMALNDKVRQLQFNITGGIVARIEGTATPLGPWYSGMSKHYIDYVVSTSGSSNFTILIATGANRGARIQEIPIVAMIPHPTLDFVLLQHGQPVVGAALPVFGSVAEDDIVTFVGYGDRHLFGQTTFVNDGQPSAFNMRVSDASDPTNFYLTSRFVSAIAGGGANLDSSSPGYNSSNQLSLFLDNGVIAPLSGVGLAGAISFIESGVAAFILANTPLNYLSPIPAALACAVAGGEVELVMSNLVPNRAYRLMRSGTLAPSSWMQAHSFTATGPTATWSEPVPTEGRQFYRLEWTE